MLKNRTVNGVHYLGNNSEINEEPWKEKELKYSTAKEFGHAIQEQAVQIKWLMPLWGMI